MDMFLGVLGMLGSAFFVNFLSAIYVATFLQNNTIQAKTCVYHERMERTISIQ